MFADSGGRVICNLTMPWDRRPAPIGRILPYRMLSAFTYELASVASHMS